MLTNSSTSYDLICSSPDALGGAAVLFKQPVVLERHLNFLSVFAGGTRRLHEYQQNEGRRNDRPSSFGTKKYEIRSSSSD
jgi:hypothetical protein